jgi:hypothetical protein
MEGPDITCRLLRECAKHEVYDFDVGDVGRVWVTIPQSVKEADGPVAVLFKVWKTWIRGATPTAMSDGRIHREIVQRLTNEGVLPEPPIIQHDLRYHDGRHRLFAMFEVLGQRPGGSVLQVYWVHDWEDGVLTHIG